MNKYWSTYVQTTEELYASRALRFREDNKQLWLNALRVTNGMKVCEIGCGGGIFCHRIKQFLPQCQVVGVDRDEGHIDFANTKSQKLNLDCTFLVADAVALPFADGTFDLCFSHTVMSFVEPVAFVAQQFRVLNTGGKIVIMTVVNHPQREAWLPEQQEEKALFDRLWQQASLNPNSNIMRYESNPDKYGEYLCDAGFVDITADTLSYLTYAPDSAAVHRDTALAQINERRLSYLSSIEKARVMAPDALNSLEFSRLQSLCNAHYDDLIDDYLRGVKHWEYEVGTLLVISATKP